MSEKNDWSGCLILLIIIVGIYLMARYCTIDKNTDVICPNYTVEQYRTIFSDDIVFLNSDGQLAKKIKKDIYPGIVVSKSKGVVKIKDVIRGNIIYKTKDNLFLALHDGCHDEFNFSKYLDE